jgi:HK97 family phage portal protein
MVDSSTGNARLELVGLLNRMIRPPDEVVPNPNDPASVPPATVGPPAASPGDPHGVVVEGPDSPGSAPPRVLPSAWSGWPADWWPPTWNGQVQKLTDTAWACVDLNASVLATMPPYLLGAAQSTDAAWIGNPDPDVYTSWEEFAKQLFWDYQLGEAFVIATAYYATGFPARFHVVPPWTVNVEMAPDGTRRYQIGRVDVTADMLHIRYQGSVSDAHGHSPLEAGAGRLVAAQVFSRYAQSFAAAGGVPTSILQHPEELTKEQAAALQAQWVQARVSQLGEPAVLSGGVTYAAVQVNPKDMALVELSQLTDSRIAVLLGVPPFLMGLPSGGDSMTYSNVTSLFDYHWRAGLRPKAQMVMSAMSQWLLPRGTNVELNRDAYVQPEPLQRAQTAEILNRIRDPQGNPALTVEEIRLIERFSAAGAAGLPPQEVSSSE